MNRIKVVLGFGGSSFDKRELDGIFKFLPHSNMLYVGAVINDLDGIPLIMPCAGGKCGNNVACVQKKEKKARQELYAYLSEKCEETACKYIIHKDEGCMPQELIRETQYADLLIINQETYNATVINEGESIPFRILLELAGCPVLVLPKDIANIEQVVMTFDGTAIAMRGIKQFSYLLPDVGNRLPVTVLTTYCEEGPPSIEEKLFIEYLKQHFTNLALHKLCDDTEHTIYSAVGVDANTLLVVNNPSPQNLPILTKLLDCEEVMSPIKLFTRAG
ncbi:hypothetical protein [Anditalea andensis]|nr:hypothetical protein [Anditalea andensis]